MTTNDAGRGTGLNLRDSQLSGPIPTELAGLGGLRVLGCPRGEPSERADPGSTGSDGQLADPILAGNNFSEPIPTELRRLSGLVVLNVSSQRTRKHK